MNVKDCVKSAVDYFGGQSALARVLAVNPVQVHDWLYGIRPVPAHICSLIEGFTEGNVSRKGLRPDDWYLIWPELVETEADKQRISDYLEARKLELSIRKKTYLQSAAKRESACIEQEKKKLAELRDKK